MNKRQIRLTHLWFILTILGFIVLVLLGLLGAYLGFWYFNTGVAFAIVFAILLVFLLLTTLFRARLDTLINRSYMLRIRGNQAPPIPIKRVRSLGSLESYLRKHEYTKFAREPQYTVFYRMKRDDLKRIFRGYILEVVVYLDQALDEFYVNGVDECVQKLQNEALQNKKKVEKILVTQIKKVETLDEATKNKIAEILFLRSQSGIISTINVAVHEESNQAVFLYSDTFSPSIYYRYHVDQIKAMM